MHLLGSVGNRTRGKHHRYRMERMGNQVTKRYLSRMQFAARIGVKPASLSRYKLPTTDVIVGPDTRPVQGWTEETIDKWNAARPGSGSRTDLKQ